MPKGIYIRKDKTNIGKYIRTESTKKKLREAGLKLSKQRSENALKQWRTDKNFRDKNLKRIQNMKGKTLEEIYGEKKASEIRKKESDSTKGQISWCKGLTRETDKRVNNLIEKRRLTIIKTGMFKGERNPFFNKKHTELTKDKIGFNNSNESNFEEYIRKKRIKEEDLKIPKMYPWNRVDLSNKEIKEIKRLYTKKLISCYHISKKFNVSERRISKILKESNLLMSLGYRRKLLYSKGKLRTKEIIFNNKQCKKIIDLYENKLYKTKKIGKIIGVSEPVILNFLKRKGINTSMSHRRKLLIANGIIKSPNEGRTYEDIHGANAKIMRRRARERMTGNRNPGWIDGRTPSPYDKNFTKRFKRLIKERDGCCLLCNVSIEDLHLLKRRVSIHHIFYNKLISLPESCCTLCDSCHSKTNFNRKHWTKFFQSLLAERYGYKYSEEGEIIFTLENQNQ